MTANPGIKVFNDPIHGSIEMHPYLVRIIDTPEFQRLRDIRQMGGVYHVYPGASHKRFEHSIGVAHLAGELVQALRKQHPLLSDVMLTDELRKLGDDFRLLIQKYVTTLHESLLEKYNRLPLPPHENRALNRVDLNRQHYDFIKQLLNLNMKIPKQHQQEFSELARKYIDLADKHITEDEGLCVQIAALCHDLGHGPFSHLFDDLFIPKVLVKLKNEVRYEGELQNEMEEDLRGINEQLKAIEARLQAMLNEPVLREIGQTLNNILAEIQTAEGQGDIEGQRQAEGEGNIEGRRQAIEELKRKYGDVKRQFKTKALGNWTHERQSIIMLNAVKEGIELNQEDTEEYRSFIDFMIENLEFIKELIDPPEGQKSNPKTFLYEIVSNKRNGIDVDKMDYFARDCYHLGIENNFNYRRFMKFARVCEFDGEMQICMRDKEVGNIYDLFHTRNNIHRKACQHKVVRAIDTMIVDALLAADEFLGISDSALEENIKDYLNMTDMIIQRILDDERCGESQAILKRIKDRDLYKGVLELRYSGQPFNEILQGKETWKVENPGASKIKNLFFVQDVVEELTEEIGENPEHIDMKVIDMTYGMKGKNPIDQMRFYRKRRLDEAIALGKRDVSRLLPSNFAEQLIHVYCKKSKMSYEDIEQLGEMSFRWFEKKGYVER